MSNLAKAFVALSALAFVLAVVAKLNSGSLWVGAEAYSRASANLALLAIALFIGFKEADGTGSG